VVVVGSDPQPETMRVVMRRERMVSFFMRSFKNITFLN
jgi:hypothetical protein